MSIPAAPDVEESVLATLMLIPSAQVPDFLAGLEDRFFTGGNRELIRVIRNVFQRHGNLSLSIVASMCQQAQNTVTRLAALLDRVPVIGSEEAALAILREKAQMREILFMAEKLQQETRATNTEPGTLMDRIQAFLNSAEYSAGEIQTMEPMMEEFLRRLKNPSPARIWTGLEDLDRILSGLYPGDLALVAARPAMGKTAFAMGILINNVTKGIPMAIFSLEMSWEQLVQRIVAGMTGVPVAWIRSAGSNPISKSSMEDLEWAAGVVAGWPMFIDDSSGLTAQEIFRRARVLRRKHGIQGVIVDYAQLLRSETRASNRNEEMGEISRTMKAMARDLGVPVVLLSQLNRMLENRADKRPFLSDLRESGALEQDADMVIFPFRPSVYDKNADPEVAEMIVAKNRQGETGVGTVRWDGPRTAFGNYEIERAYARV